MSINTMRISSPSDPNDIKVAIGNLFTGIFIFCIPMFKFIELEIVGRLFFSELLLLIIFMFMLVTKKIYLRERTARIAILFCLLWLCGQIATDLIRDTKFIDYVRGWAKITFTLINFIALYVILENRKRLVIIFAAGIAAGGVLEFYLNPGVYAYDYPWKFGVGPSITWLFILIAAGCSKKNYLLSIVLIAIISGLNLIMGFRSLSGICFLTAVYLMLQWAGTSKMRKEFEISAKSICILATILLMTSFCFISGYGYLASKGVLGDGARQVYEGQASGILGVLIGGRSEILISWRAITDSPVIGHGSWAKNEEYADALIEVRSLLGYFDGEAVETDLIPTHSHIFGAWVEAGFFGAVFWLWVLFLPIKCLTSLIRTKEPLSPLYAYICFLLIWDIFFSPYSADRRFITPYYMVALMVFLSGFNKEKYSGTQRIKKMVVSI